MDQLALKGHFENGVVHFDSAPVGIADGTPVTVVFVSEDEIATEFPSGLSKEELRQQGFARMESGMKLKVPFNRDALYERD